MDRWAWPTTVKVIVGLMVAGMVAGSVLFVVQVYELTGPFPAETGVFVDDISAGNEYISARYRAGLRAGCAVRARVRGARRCSDSCFLGSSAPATAVDRSCAGR